ncbi:MAG: hypothetical protein H6602_12445 [Flavobacteriales bacterium]|nr:hypothetical protein [Flavobacteriales bacterium]
MKKLLPIVFTLTAMVGFSQTMTLSPLETVQVKESNAFWKAKLDPESDITLINSSSIAVMNASFPMEKNVTKNISFKLKNADGKGRTVNAVVTGIQEWQGEKYYTVELEIGVNVLSKWDYRKADCVLVELTDSEYKLIIGKNWLGDDIEVK